MTIDPVIDLYRDSFPDFARMVRRMGGSLEQAKDSFHDALLIYLEKEKAGKLQINSSAKGYLLGTARICWLRAQDKLVLPLVGDFSPPDVDEPDMEEVEKSLLQSLLKSGKKCMELLQAFYYDHCSMQDIAIRFGFNGRKSATTQKYKCLERVREQIRKTEAYA